jgi:tetratricopeptide (TPR) repeat protein
MLEVKESGITKPSEAFRRLSAERAISGGIYKSGDKVQIVLSLIDGMSGKLLDQRTLDTQFNSLKVQNQIIEAAIALLKLELTPAQQLELRAQGTEDPSVYTLYLEGKGLLDKVNLADTDAAIGLFQRALAQDSGFSLAHAGLGMAYRSKFGQGPRDKRLTDQALSACNEAVTGDRNLAAGHVCRGAVYRLRGEYPAAIQEFNRARELHPTSEEVYEIYEGLGRAYERMDKLDEAEALYEEAIRTRPNYWRSYVWLGQFYATSRPRYAEAARLLQEAVNRAPDNPVAHFGLCGVQTLMGDQQGALKSCGMSIQFRPTYGAYQNQGVIYFNLRQYPKAAEAFEHARALRPDYYKLAGHLARSYFWMGRTADATSLYGEAIRLANQELAVDPNSASVHVMLARYHAMLGQRQAFFHLGVALKQAPNEPEYQCIAAVVHNQFDERSEALRYLEQAFAFGYSPTEIEAERELDNLREDPQFRALIARQTARRDTSGNR